MEGFFPQLESISLHGNLCSDNTTIREELAHLDYYTGKNLSLCTYPTGDFVEVIITFEALDENNNSISIYNNEYFSWEFDGYYETPSDFPYTRTFNFNLSQPNETLSGNIGWMYMTNESGYSVLKKDMCTKAASWGAKAGSGASTIRITHECIPSDIPAEERDALIAFYNATDGDNWTNNVGWLGEEGTECSWAGVVCDEKKEHVILLEAVNRNLNGSLPPEIGNFSHLTNINILDNPHLSGNIPAEIGNLENLKLLYLFRNNLSGEIPSEIENLSNLSVINFDDNNFSGRLPVEIGNLTEMKNILLANNNFSGSIPKEFSSLTKLFQLKLDNTLFTGRINPELHSLFESMEILQMSGTNLCTDDAAFASLLRNKTVSGMSLPPIEIPICPFVHEVKIEKPVITNGNLEQTIAVVFQEEDMSLPPEIEIRGLTTTYFPTGGVWGTTWLTNDTYTVTFSLQDDDELGDAEVFVNGVSHGFFTVDTRGTNPLYLSPNSPPYTSFFTTISYSDSEEGIIAAFLISNEDPAPTNTRKDVRIEKLVFESNRRTEEDFSNFSFWKREVDQNNNESEIEISEAQISMNEKKITVDLSKISGGGFIVPANQTHKFFLKSKIHFISDKEEDINVYEINYFSLISEETIAKTDENNENVLSVWQGGKILETFSNSSNCDMENIYCFLGRDGDLEWNMQEETFEIYPGQKDAILGNMTFRKKGQSIDLGGLEISVEKLNQDIPDGMVLFTNVRFIDTNTNEVILGPRDFIEKGSVDDYLPAQKWFTNILFDSQQETFYIDDNPRNLQILADVNPNLTLEEEYRLSYNSDLFFYEGNIKPGIVCMMANYSFCDYSFYLASSPINYEEGDIMPYRHDDIALIKTIRECISSDWETSEWSQCSHGEKSRTVTKINSCAGETAKPSEIEYCPCTESDWETTEWGTCTDGQKSRTVTKKNSCTGETGKPAETETCACTTNDWTTSEWSQCSNGEKTRTVTKKNSCSGETGKPIEKEYCACTASDWETGAWSSCSGSQQTRAVTKKNSCTGETEKPSETQSCSVSSGGGGNRNRRGSIGAGGSDSSGESSSEENEDFTPCTNDNWEIGEWGACEEEKQSRIITKIGECSNGFEKPNEERDCILIPEEERNALVALYKLNLNS